MGGYLWAVISVRQEQLQVRCLEETHVIKIQPPLQIVYLGNGCEGYSPSMFLPAKNEMATHAQIESRKEYFLQVNYVYTQDRYIGLWWQCRTKMMSEKEAKAFITQVAPLGTMDYSLLHKRPLPIIWVCTVSSSNNTRSRDCSCNTTNSWDSAWLLRVLDGKTLKSVTGTVKQVTEKPISGCRLLFSRIFKRK